MPADTQVIQSVQRKRQRPSPAKDRARALLRDMLADGPVDSTTVEEAAARLGVSRGTLFAARRELGVRADRVGYGGDGGWRLWSAEQWAAREVKFDRLREAFDALRVRLAARGR